MKAFFSTFTRKVSLIFLLAIFIFVSCQNPLVINQRGVSANLQVASATYLEPSQDPPGGLLPEEAPMLIAFGWDDNGKSDGMDWALEMAAKYSNPPGIGNSSTFDGNPITMTFLNSSYYVANWGSESPVLVKQAWRKAYERGHEIGNHTNTHPHGSSYSVEQWNNEIDNCNTWLTNSYDPDELIHTPTSSGIGVPLSDIHGFRTPYLEYNDNLFSALANRGWYDCSIEEGFEEYCDGTNYYWPYTLDNGSPGHDVQVGWGSKTPLSNHPGLWEMPVYTFIVPQEDRDYVHSVINWFDVNGGKITGFDYNLWSLAKMNKQMFVDTLKHSLDLRLEGNRAPMLIGAHTDYYVDSYTTPNASNIERRAAIEEFIQYALTKDDVRIVSYEEALQWIKNPVPLNQNSERFTISASVSGSGSIIPSGNILVPEGASKTFTFSPDFGSKIENIVIDGNVLSAMDSYTFTSINQNHSIQVNFVGENNYDPSEVKATTLSLVSIAENSSPYLVWNYAENIGDGRGITFGICGFTSGTYDGTKMIRQLKDLDSNHPLVSYLPAFQYIDTLPHDENWTTDVTIGLENFIDDFNRYGEDSIVREAQFMTLENMYWNPAQQKAEELGVKYPVSMAFIYDTTVNHGATGDENDKGLKQLTDEANLAMGGTPATGIDELTWLYKLLDVRKAYLESDPTWAGALDRIEMYRRLLDSGNRDLALPLNVSCYGDNFTIRGGEIDLTFDQTLYTVTAEAGSGGFVAPEGNIRIVSGSTVTIDISADENYMIDYVVVDGYNHGAISEVVITNVRENHNVNAYFKPSDQETVQVTASSGANGTIVPSGLINVSKGSNKTFTFSPDSGYVIDSVFVDGINVGNASSYTMNNIEKDSSINVIFKEDQGAECNIGEYDPAKVYLKGDLVHYNNKHWEAQWWTKGETPGTTGEWGVWRDKGNCDVAVIINHSVSVTAGSNGTISPSGIMDVEDGKSIDFSIIANSGYQVEDVFVNGSSVGVISLLSLTINSDTTVYASFKLMNSSGSWKSGVSYGIGDIVEYNSINYICTYAHVSNDAWVPGTAGLWFWEVQ